MKISRRVGRASCMLLLGMLFGTALPTRSTLAHESAAMVDNQKMREAALAWRDTLGPELAGRASFAFDGRQRTDWHFIPKDRIGVHWGEMNLEQRRAAQVLLRTALSSQGFFKAVTIMSLEEELRRLQSDRPNVARIRDQEKYWFALFGDPASEEPWGWRIEGHHLWSRPLLRAFGVLGREIPAFQTMSSRNWPPDLLG